MTGSSRKGFPFAKIVTVLAIIFGVGLGLCGLSIVVAGLGAGHSGAVTALGGSALGMASIIGLIAMVVSGPLLVITVIVWVFAEVFRSRQ